jgi:hypothetical protein
VINRKFEITNEDILFAFRNNRSQNKLLGIANRYPHVRIQLHSGNKFLPFLFAKKVGIRVSNSDNDLDNMAITLMESRDCLFKFSTNNVKLIPIIHKSLKNIGYAVDFQDYETMNYRLNAVKIYVPITNGAECRRVFGHVATLIENLASLDINLNKRDNERHGCIYPGCKSYMDIHFPHLCYHHARTLKAKTMIKLVNGTAINELSATDLETTEERNLAELVSLLVGAEVYRKYSSDRGPIADKCILCNDAIKNDKGEVIKSVSWSCNSICSNCDNKIDWKTFESDYRNMMISWEDFIDGAMYKKYLMD